MSHEVAGCGAAAGAVVARRKTRRTKAEASQQAIAEQAENFKKAFSVCLEAKKYMVKF